jgi:phosphomannomutase
MTDLECYINALGFLEYLAGGEFVKPGATVYLAGDLRDSTPRITRSMLAAIRDAGNEVEYLGLVPTPALALRSLGQGGPGIMVTGSHIPADRNGIKFYKPDSEVLKADEAGIKAAVAKVRARIYAEDTADSMFGMDGMLKDAPELPGIKPEGQKAYLDRYAKFFGPERLKGKQLVFYQHSAVGRDMLVELLERIGAQVKPVGRSDVFVPIDTEDVTVEHQEYFRKVAKENPGMFAMVSTDGDSDRPFVIDETGEFHRGDVLGAVVARWLGADAAAFPVSTSDAVTQLLDEEHVSWTATKIGSPYVIDAMNAEAAAGKKAVVGWEVNGGFLTASTLEIGGEALTPLPTRDAIFPIIVALSAAMDAGVSVAKLFARLPQRFTQAGLIDNFPPEISKAILASDVAPYFTPEQGFGKIRDINRLDGLRLFFDNGEIAHLRPSGNAPQLRIYSVADTQERADEIVEMALAEPDGILRRMEKDLG